VTGPVGKQTMTIEIRAPRDSDYAEWHRLWTGYLDYY